MSLGFCVVGSDASWHPEGCVVHHLPQKSPVESAGNLWRERTEADGDLTHIILHCIDPMINAGGVKGIFESDGVSAHYVVKPEGTVTEYVSPDKIAFHAGPSSFGEISGFNKCSIGIEFESPGYAKGGADWFHFEPFTDAQRAAGIALVSQLVERFGIDRQNILGHSDIAPLRKTDPGATFFWKELYTGGFGLPVLDWADGDHMTIADVQGALRDIGYCTTPETGILDEPTARGILAFQQHFVQSRFEDENYAKTLLAKLNIEQALDLKTLGALQFLSAHVASARK